MVRALAAALLLFASAADAQESWVGIDAKIGASVVRLESTVDGELDGICSAVIIAPGYVLTAAHCVPTKPEGRSIAVDRKHAEAMRVNYALDLAVLRVVDLKGPALTVRTTEVPIGTPVVLAGFAYGAQRAKYTFGWVADTSDVGLVVGILLDATIVPGASGGSLCDSAGHLISVLQAYQPSRAGYLAVAAPPQEVAAFVRPFIPVPAAK